MFGYLQLDCGFDVDTVFQRRPQDDIDRLLPHVPPEWIGVAKVVVVAVV